MVHLNMFACFTLVSLSSVVIADEKYVSYEPTTSVADYANIALDLRTIESQLAIGTLTGKINALEVYGKGAYTKSYANVTLKFPLDSSNIQEGTKVAGYNSKGDKVNGVVMMDAVKGDSTILVQYIFPPEQKIHLNCYVGGIPQAVVEGCFQNAGNLSIGQLSGFEYTYNVLEDTRNGITLQGLSTNADADMSDSDGRFFKMMRRFNKYYGVPDYANKWVAAAFRNEATNFPNGNARFTGYDGEGTSVAIVDGISYLHIWMYVIRQMEYSLDACSRLCVGCDYESLHAWDVAVALYTGSNFDSPSENGMLLCTLAETICEFFGTCDNDLNGKIYDLFNRGKSLLLNEMDCTPLDGVIEEITKLMTVPLVQGMLYEAYRKDNFRDSRERVEAKGATFAAAVLPIVDYCNHNWAELIYKNMRLGYDGSGSFIVVKDAIERNYDCMKISCEDVGGILNLIDGTYHADAEPCDPNKQPVSSKSLSSEPSTPKSSTKSDGSLSVGAVVGISLGAIAIALISLLLVYRKMRKRKEQPTDLEMETSVDVKTPSIV